jgi:hypothetical protein
MVVLAMLLGTASVAFAEPQQGPIIWGDYDPDMLGDVWTYYYDGFFPGERVDVFMYRPPTAEWCPGCGEWHDLGWPAYGGWVGPLWGTWYWGSSAVGQNDVYMDPPEDPDVWGQVNDSEMRRMNLTNEDEVFLFADEFGWYYAEFMHSRDEVWFPCSFPLKWKCNYWLDPFTPIFHSPYAMAYECIGPFCLEWPWAVDPQDIVSPLEVHTYGEGWIWGSAWWIEPYEVLGMYWKWSDIP